MLKPLAVWITTYCGKFLKRWGVPDHFAYLLRNLCASQEATVRTGRGANDWFRIRQEYVKIVYFHTVT